MSVISSAVQSLQEYLWSFPMLVLLLGTHIYFTFHLHFIQRKIFRGIRLSFSKESRGSGAASPFAALSTALAATIGTGNIIGISTAIAIGGPGAVFWCWLTGLLGIATCYAECYLSARFRVRQKDGSYRGGPMYVMEHVLQQKSAALLFAVSVILVSLGMGSSVQSHSIAAAMTEQVRISPRLVGVLTAVLVGVVIWGGARQIMKICTWLVPFMSVFYLGGCVLLLWMNRSVLPETLRVIVCSAFTSRSVVGGIAGTAVALGMRAGISRGLFTNEAGLGSVPMAAAAANTLPPEQQGLVSMTGTFWDTVVMCAVTGIAIVSSMLRQPEVFLDASADRLCFLVFSAMKAGDGETWWSPFLNGSFLLSAALILFAFATIIGWSYYGECAVHYLWRGRGMVWYRGLYVLAVYFGAVWSLDMVWNLSDLFNACMAIPNLLCLWMLRKVIKV